MERTDIIILGAGAAGLMAACTIAGSARRFILLEGRSRIGGRIDTCQPEGFTELIERGAEFIHGNLPLTLAMLEKAGLSTVPLKFAAWQHKDGKIEQVGEMIEDWDILIKSMQELQQDMPLGKFLESRFSGKQHILLREQTLRYVSGYDTANAADASCFALRREWANEDQDAQQRISQGYASLMEHMASCCTVGAGRIVLDSLVTEVNWQEETIVVSCGDGRQYQAAKLVIALPLGVLQAGAGQAGTVNFRPPLGGLHKALHNIGFGSVIKIVMEFDSTFWNDGTGEAHGDKIDRDIGFLFTEEAVPTFWTQLPSRRPLLTAWLGGDRAMARKNHSPEELLDEALISLARVFDIHHSRLRKWLKAWSVANWGADQLTRGSYSYDKTGSAAARSLLKKGLAERLYFAGEYLYNGSAMGTVEAALSSGKCSAEQLLRDYEKH